MDMKKGILWILIACLLFGSASLCYADTDTETELTLVGKGAILIDASTGKVLYEKNSHEKYYPASTTKIITAILALENIGLDDTVPIDGEIAFTGGSRIYLLEGEKVMARELMYGLLLESANDVAVAFAKKISGSTEKFAVLMNEKAKEYGALNTNFVNPNGLQDEKHVSTAYDLAMIAKYAMKNETFRKYVKTYKYKMPATNMQDTRYFYNTNRLLYDTVHEVSVNGVLRDCKYEGITGIKTGFTPEAGGCLVASAKRGDTELIAVTMASTDMDRFGDCIALLDYGFANYKTVPALDGDADLGMVKVKRGAVSRVAAAPKEAVFATLPKEASQDVVRTEIVLSDSLKAPVKKGQKAGVVKVYAGNDLVGEYDAVVTQAVKKGGPLSVIGISDAAARLMLFVFLGLIALLILSLVVYVFYKRRQIRIRREKRQKEREEMQRQRAMDRARWEEEFFGQRERRWER